MICPKCGVDTDGKFCPNCGTPLGSPEESEPVIIERVPSDQSTSQADSAAEKQDNSRAPTERNDAVCPFCKAPECTPVQKNKTETKTKGYKWGSGCCGMFLLGPFGLLCGLCGSGSKTKTESELWWVCTKCGKQHIALEEAIKKWEDFISRLPVMGVTLGVGLTIFRLIFKWMLGSGIIVSILALIAPIVLAVSAINGLGKEYGDELIEQLGESFEPYLTKEQENEELKNGVIAMVLAVAIILIGTPILNAWLN